MVIESKALNGLSSHKLLIIDMKQFRIEVHYNYDIAFDKFKSYNVCGRSLRAAVGRALAMFKKDTKRERIKQWTIKCFTL